MSRVVILAGGTGGAKLAQGLQAVLPPGDLTVIVNTGDDVERHGLLVMPDHDAVLYMLGGRFDFERGWGIAGETWTVMDGLKAYGEEGWFGLGDRDFATHIARSARIRSGASLTDAVLSLQSGLGLATRILPMTDSPVRTQVLTDDGWLEFQEYFVRRHQAPDVREVRFDGIEGATPTAAVLDALAAADLIVIGPSNPIVSLGPILAVPGMTDAIDVARGRGVPVQSVSGIVGGRALKGPADRMLVSLGHESSALGVARLLAPHTDLFVLDEVDRDAVGAVAGLGLGTHVTDTIMADEAGRARLAADLLAVAAHGVPLMSEPDRIAAIVPVAAIEGAKTRLGETLDAEERHDLVEGLVARTLEAVESVARIDDVLVISPDRTVLDWATDVGARTLRQRTSGLNAGVREARDDVIAGGAQAVIIVPIDLPFITTAALDDLIGALFEDPGPTVVLAPDRHGTGTNALALRPPNVIDVSFGSDSRAAHRVAAATAGVTYREVDGPLSVDLDTPEDLVLVDTIRAEDPMSADGTVRVVALEGIPEVVAGDDLAALIGDALDRTAGVLPLTGEDVLVVTQKIVSKAEGAVVDLTAIQPRPEAVEFAERWDRDPRQVEVVLQQAKRIVRMANGVLITETPHGFVCANGGVDASNVGPASGSIVTLLPVDPDASAARIRAAVEARFGQDVPVIVSDSFGRPWRWGIVDVAIGVSGLLPLDDLRGSPDADGRVMHSTVRAVADELASAAELALGKSAGRPVALVRGAAFTRGEARIADALIPGEMDLFR